MIEICKKHTLQETVKGVVFKEAYIPYMPSQYCGILAVAEAQNLGGINDGYVNNLTKMTSLQRMDRLRLSKETEGFIRIQPWMDGSIPMALECGLGVNPNTVAVSNSVLWSMVSDSGKNLNPNKFLIDKSQAFWRDILPSLNCHTVVTVGSVARDVFASINNVRLINFRSSSPVSMGLYCGSVPNPMPIDIRNKVDGMKQKYPGYFNKNIRFKEAYLYHAITTIAQQGGADGARDGFVPTAFRSRIRGGIV